MAVNLINIINNLPAHRVKIINMLDFNFEKLRVIRNNNNDNQQNKYHQIWKEILKLINGGNGELKLHEKIKIIDSDLPIEHVFKIPSIAIAIKSLIEKNDKFYLELSLNYCLYEI